MEFEQLTDTCYVATNKEFAVVEEESGDFWIALDKNGKAHFTGIDANACILWINTNKVEH